MGFGIRISVYEKEDGFAIKVLGYGKRIKHYRGIKLLDRVSMIVDMEVASGYATYNQGKRLKEIIKT